MNEARLKDEEKTTLLRIARDALEARARGAAMPPLPPGLSETLLQPQGAFVSLHQEGDLRGCIGTFFADEALAHAVQKMAVAAGWEDPRFRPLSASELARIQIEISALSPLRPIEDLKEIEVGKHGLFVTKGMHRGVLLPQVATEYGWDRERFLDQTCVKAGLRADAWRKGGVKVEVFSAEVFGEHERGRRA